MIAILRLNAETLFAVEVPDDWAEVEGVFEGYDPYNRTPEVFDGMDSPGPRPDRALQFD